MPRFQTHSIQRHNENTCPSFKPLGVSWCITTYSAKLPDDAGHPTTSHTPPTLQGLPVLSSLHSQTDRDKAWGSPKNQTLVVPLSKSLSSRASGLISTARISSSPDQEWFNNSEVCLLFQQFHKVVSLLCQHYGLILESLDPEVQQSAGHQMPGLLSACPL